MLEVVPANVAAIREAIERANASMDLARGAVQVAIRDRVIAGRLLIAEREKMEHGEWLAWLEANVPDFSDQTARRWMKLAQFAEMHGADLESASSVRQAYQLAGLLPEPEPSSGESSEGQTSYLTHLVRSATHLDAQLSQRPIETWALEDRRILRARLEPLVRIYERLSA